MTSITIRLTKELALWLSSTSRRTGLSRSALVRDYLERAANQPRFMRLAGSVNGAPSLSALTGFRRRAR